MSRLKIVIEYKVIFWNMLIGQGIGAYNKIWSQ